MFRNVKIQPKQSQNTKCIYSLQQVVSGVSILSCKCQINTHLCIKCQIKAVFITGTKIDFPQYLRFEAIKLVDKYGDFNGKPFDEKRFELISPLLFQLKSAFVNSRLDLAYITRNELDFVQEKLLPIFDCCKHFKFDFVKCYPDEGSAFLASLLQHPSIRSASSVQVKCHDSAYDLYNSPGAQLPIEAISNWLHKPNSGSKITEKRFLEVLFIKTENTLEMIKHLNEAPNFCI